mmetsp:Transcript_51477/g.130009  ORF Transcript_51477/g.130009 Transcript_51477/m.130009 type:complete len:227 (+) Transcript_51477:689-1369(+)
MASERPFYSPSAQEVVEAMPYARRNAKKHVLIMTTRSSPRISMRERLSVCRQSHRACGASLVTSSQARSALTRRTHDRCTATLAGRTCTSWWADGCPSCPSSRTSLAEIQVCLLKLGVDWMLTASPGGWPQLQQNSTSSWMERMMSSWIAWCWTAWTSGCRTSQRGRRVLTCRRHRVGRQASTCLRAMIHSCSARLVIGSSWCPTASAGGWRHSRCFISTSARMTC